MIFQSYEPFKSPVSYIQIWYENHWTFISCEWYVGSGLMVIEKNILSSIRYRPYLLPILYIYVYPSSTSNCLQISLEDEIQEEWTELNEIQESKVVHILVFLQFFQFLVISSIFLYSHLSIRIEKLIKYGTYLKQKICNQVMYFDFCNIDLSRDVSWRGRHLVVSLRNRTLILRYLSSPR